MSNIINLFSIPLYKSKLERQLTQEELDIIFTSPLEPYAPDFYAKPTVNREILNLPKLDNLNKLILEHVKYYAKNIMCVDNEFYITSSWVSVNKPNAFHQKHFHGNSVLSGAFYVQVDDKSSPMTYTREKNVTNNDVFQFRTTSANEYNSLEQEVKVSNGDILIWPSWVPHQVPPNESQTDRVLISFNTFVKGSMGYVETSTALEL